jgi:hypothetical protein
VIGGSGTGSAIGALVLGNPGEKDTLCQFIEFVSFGATLVGLFLWVRVKEGRPFSSIGFRGHNPIGKLGPGLRHRRGHDDDRRARLPSDRARRITLYAVLACFVALGRGNHWLIAGLHAGWNYFQGNIYGLPVSGTPEASSWFAFGPTAGSSDIVSGGDFGVEASIVGSAILVVAVIVSFTYHRREEAQRTAGEHSAATA